MVQRTSDYSKAQTGAVQTNFVSDGDAKQISDFDHFRGQKVDESSACKVTTGLREKVIVIDSARVWLLVSLSYKFWVINFGST